VVFARPVDGCEVSGHDEIVPGAKTMTPRASAASPLYNLGANYKSVRAGEAN
jgi:hypothetical protein